MKQIRWILSDDLRIIFHVLHKNIWAPSSEFVSLSIPSWQILTAHAQPFREARDLAFCLKVLLDSLLVWASSGGSGETARMHRLTWTFAARICDKYQIRLTRSICCWYSLKLPRWVPTTYFFTESCRKSSFNYHEIPTSLWPSQSLTLICLHKTIWLHISNMFQTE